MAGYEGLVNFPGNNSYAAAAYTGTAITDVSPTPQYTFPGGSLKVGDTLRVTAFGRYTSSVTATNLTAGIYYGGVAGVALGASAATAITVSLTNAPWRLEYLFRVLTVGASGTAFGQGRLNIASSLTSLGTDIAVPGTANAAVTIDTTTAKALTLGFTSSVAQSYTVDGFFVEQLTITP